MPAQFRTKFVAAYLQLKRSQAEGRSEQAGLSVGKLCEACLRLLQHETTGAATPFGKQIPNFADECRKIISSSSASAPETIRVVVPRALVFLYTMRSKRGIGHVGGDVEPNDIDLATMARLADWVVCELIRVYHRLSLEEAQDLVDSLSIRDLPDVWEVAGKKRVLREGLTAKQQVLLLLYSDPAAAVLAEDLCAWVEYAQLPVFRRDVLRPLHVARLVEFDATVDTVQLSPIGAKEVEERILRGGPSRNALQRTRSRVTPRAKHGSRRAAHR
jgi:hypothetical protein